MLRVTLKPHEVVHLPRSVALGAPSPRVIDYPIDLIPRLPILGQRRRRVLDWHASEQAWLRAEECPIPGDKHFKFPWTGPFTNLAVTPSTATLELPNHWRLLSSTFHFRPRSQTWAHPKMNCLIPSGCHIAYQLHLAFFALIQSLLHPILERRDKLERARIQRGLRRQERALGPVGVVQRRRKLLYVDTQSARNSLLCARSGSCSCDTLDVVSGSSFWAATIWSQKWVCTLSGQPLVDRQPGQLGLTLALHEARYCLEQVGKRGRKSANRGMNVMK
jgi:hypothetical protein